MHEGSKLAIELSELGWTKDELSKREKDWGHKADELQKHIKVQIQQDGVYVEILENRPRAFALAS